MARRPDAHKDWTKPRAVRINDELWEAAQHVARQRGETLADVIRRSLQGYVTRHGSKDDNG